MAKPRETYFYSNFDLFFIFQKLYVIKDKAFEGEVQLKRI